MEMLKDNTTDFDTAKFTLVDYIIFFSLIVISIGIGLYSAFMKDNSTKKEFLVGGKSMPVIPVALSLVGGAISAISIMGNYSFSFLI